MLELIIVSNIIFLLNRVTVTQLRQLALEKTPLEDIRSTF